MKSDKSKETFHTGEAGYLCVSGRDCVRRYSIGLSQIFRPWRTRLQRGCIFLKPLVIVPTDLHQEGKICRCYREFRQWLNRYGACELCDMDFVGAKCEGR